MVRQTHSGFFTGGPSAVVFVCRRNCPCNAHHRVSACTDRLSSPCVFLHVTALLDGTCMARVSLVQGTGCLSRALSHVPPCTDPTMPESRFWLHFRTQCRMIRPLSARATRVQLFVDLADLPRDEVRVVRGNLLGGFCASYSTVQARDGRIPSYTCDEVSSLRAQMQKSISLPLDVCGPPMPR